MNSLSPLSAPRFGKVERIRHYGNWNNSPLNFEDHAIEMMKESTDKKPVRLIGTYVGDIFGQIRCVPAGLNWFKVTGKRDINTLSKLVKRYDDENAKVQATAIPQRDITERNKAGKAVIESLFKKAGIPFSISSGSFEGEPTWNVNFADSSYAQVFKAKLGRDWEPYTPKV